MIRPETVKMGTWILHPDEEWFRACEYNGPNIRVLRMHHPPLGRFFSAGADPMAMIETAVLECVPVRCEQYGWLVYVTKDEKPMLVKTIDRVWAAIEFVLCIVRLSTFLT
jgi:hypothetical protein